MAARADELPSPRHRGSYPKRGALDGAIGAPSDEGPGLYYDPDEPEFIEELDDEGWERVRSAQWAERIMCDKEGSMGSWAPDRVTQLGPTCCRSPSTTTR